jgi:hypothetical protein
MKKSWLVLTIALLVSATPLVAGIGEGSWEVGFSFGGAQLDSEASEDGAFYFEVRGGYFVTDHLQLEGQASDASTEGGETEESLSSLHLNLVGNLSPSKSVVPYVLAGVGSTTLGTARDLGPYRVIVEDDSTSYQVAIGARFYTRRDGRLAVRVELSGRTDDTFDTRKNHAIVSFGVTWRLGKVR